MHTCHFVGYQKKLTISMFEKNTENAKYKFRYSEKQSKKKESPMSSEFVGSLDSDTQCNPRSLLASAAS